MACLMLPGAVLAVAVAADLCGAGDRVPIDESCQLRLPVSFDPATGAAKMQHVEEWDPWK